MSKKETKVIALHVIQRTIKPGVHGDRAKGVPGTPPEVQTIDPGMVFMASNEIKPGERLSEYDSLMKGGAIRDYTAEDHAVFARLSNVVGGGQFEEEDGTASVVQKVIKPKKPAKEAAAAAEGDGEGAIKSSAPKGGKAKAAAADAGNGDGSGDGDGDGDGDANNVV